MTALVRSVGECALLRLCIIEQRGRGRDLQWQSVPFAVSVCLAVQLKVFEVRVDDQPMGDVANGWDGGWLSV